MLIPQTRLPARGFGAPEYDRVMDVGFCALAIWAQVVPGFPAYPPTPDADPATRHPVEVSMPTRLSIQRTSSSLSVSYDLASFRKVKITVGKKMTIGVKDEFRVYPKREARPAQYRELLEGSMNEAPDPNLLKSSETLTMVQDGIPAQGQRYIIEHDIIVFETDIPAQHMWSPTSSRNYRILWEKKLNAVR
jgi:hypothetical protein